MTRKQVIGLFVPHAGCPHRCTFCDQTGITGRNCRVTPAEVRDAVRIAVERHPDSFLQLAYFGGSFTAIPREDMLELLEAARPYVSDGTLTGIRISTRPDAIDDGILSCLRDYGVEAIELGAQSMDDRVLFLNRRGHDAESVRTASRLIREHGFELGLQMMTGLYGSTPEDDLRTAEELIALHPDTVRIYPTVTLEHTELARLYRSGDYVPPSLEETVSLGAELLLRFHEAHIPVIRFGLHSGGDVSCSCVAGPYHPALRELCESRIYLGRAREALEALEPAGEEKAGPRTVTLWVAPSEISKMAGQNRKNIIELEKYGVRLRIRPRADLPPYTVIAEERGF